MKSNDWVSLLNGSSFCVKGVKSFVSSIKEDKVKQLFWCVRTRGLDWTVETNSEKQVEGLVILSNDLTGTFGIYTCSSKWYSFCTFQLEIDFKLNSYENSLLPKITLDVTVV